MIDKIQEDKYKQIKTALKYHKLLDSGLFFEFYPELTGTWEIDLIAICPNAKRLQDLSYFDETNTNNITDETKPKIYSECTKCGSRNVRFEYTQNHSFPIKRDKYLVCLSCEYEYKLTDSEIAKNILKSEDRSLNKEILLQRGDKNA